MVSIRNSKDKTALNAAAGSAPRHLALALNSGGKQSPSLQESAAALQSVYDGCVEYNIAFLTIVPPPGETEIFEAAFSLLKQRLQQSGGKHPAVLVSGARDGRSELVEAVKQLATQVRRGELSPEQINAENLERNLSTAGLPAVDLLIATGGGAKLAGVLLWQTAYAELLFADVPWFNFNRDHFETAMADYAQRCRKFGGLA
jgi:undecaprenyl diphosphate synthase